MKRNLGSFFYNPKKKPSEVSAKRWNLFSIVKKVLQKTCMALGTMMLFSILLSISLLIFIGNKGAAPLPDDMILVLRIENGVAEINSDPTILDPFPFRQPTVRRIVDTLDKAAKDDRVRGLLVSYQGGGISIAHTQELRKAIARFRDAGKFAKIYSPSYMTGQGGIARYYLASAFDEIWMQPVGLLSVSGLNAEMPFVKKPLDKIGVTAQFKQREEFKSAMETFTNDSISASNKRMLESLIGNLSMQMMNDISDDRQIPLKEIGNAVETGILTGKEAIEAKLIDRLDYGDVMLSEIRTELGDNEEEKNIKLTSLGRYASEKKQNMPTKESVALIYVTGAIVDQADTSGNSTGANIAEAITKAHENKDIKAIVLRVDSPGGSPTASETIRRALVKAKLKGKKVIVSMGSVAASGGYWISTDADKIFASPGTLTGSIGVVMGKFEASELWKKLDVNWDGTKFGKNSDFWSMNKPFNDANDARLDVLIDNVYDAFLTRVSEGRGISIEEARKIAKGRAWTGKQALDIKLVDALGGLEDALNETAIMLNLNDRNDLKIIRLPKELSPIERLVETLNGQASMPPFLKSFGPLLKKLNQMALMSEANTTTYDPSLEAFR